MNDLPMSKGEGDVADGAVLGTGVGAGVGVGVVVLREAGAGAAVCWFAGESLMVVCDCLKCRSI